MRGGVGMIDFAEAAVTFFISSPHTDDDDVFTDDDE